jgi:hypothetical protein
MSRPEYVYRGGRYVYDPGAHWQNMAEQYYATHRRQLSQPQPKGGGGSRVGGLGGAVSGAVIGGVMGGPVGAVIGGLLGGALGSRDDR